MKRLFISQVSFNSQRLSKEWFL